MTSYPAQYFGSAKPIVNQTNSGVNSLVAQVASGGGGGGGPNLAVSTLTIASQASVDAQNLTLLVDSGNNVLFNGGVNNINMPITGSLNISSLTVSSINGATPGGGGGTLPTDPSFSTIAMNGGIIFNSNAGANTVVYGVLNATLNDGTSPVGGGVSDGTGSSVSRPFYAGEICLAGNVAYGTVPLGTLKGGYPQTSVPASLIADCRAFYINDHTNSTAGVIYVSTILCSTINGTPPGGAVGPSISVSTINNLSTINLGTPGLLQVAGDVAFVGGYIGASAISTNQIGPLSPGGAVTISSINVSSVNGQPVGGGGGSSLQFSSISVPGGPGNSFICNPGVANPIVSFSTVAGHVYSACAQARAQIFIDVLPGNQIITEILDDNVGNDFFGSWTCDSISTQTTYGQLQQVGGTVVWKAGGTGASFSCVPNVSTTIRLDALNIIDYGAI